MTKRKGESTFDREMRDPGFRAAFEKETAALEVSEFPGEADGRAGNICSRFSEEGLRVCYGRSGDQIGKAEKH